MHSWIPCNCWEIINIKAPILKSITILKKSKELLNQAWSMRRWPMSCGVEVRDVYIHSPTTIEMQIMFKRETPQAMKISYLNQNDDKYANVSISCELMVSLSLHSGSIHPCFHRVFNQYWQSQTLSILQSILYDHEVERWRTCLYFRIPHISSLSQALLVWFNGVLIANLFFSKNSVWLHLAALTHHTTRCQGWAYMFVPPEACVPSS